jgi:murein DD-endopeptidase MepM/ murein hydrolase activator NlpD
MSVDVIDPDECGEWWMVLMAVAAMVAVVVIGIIITVTFLVKPASGQTLGPPVYGPVVVGHTYRSEGLPNARSCPAMTAFYGDCFYHPYPAFDLRVPIGTPVRAVAPGVVVLRGHEREGDGDPEGCDQPGAPVTGSPNAFCRRPGRFVVIAHAPPYPPLTVYKHLSVPAQVGDTVGGPGDRPLGADPVP